MMLQSRRGMGQTPADSAAYQAAAATPTGTDPLDVTFPWYCDIPIIDTLFELTTSNCTPPTQAQLTAMQTAQLAQVAAVNPALAAQGVAAGNAASAALANTDPAGAAAYNASINSPFLSALLGTNIANYLTGINPNTNQPETPGMNWLLIVAVAGGVLFFMALEK